MKLYATITSERASKGQGGNKYLFVDFQIGNERDHIGQIELELLDEKLNENREWLLKWKFAENDDWEILKQGHIRTNKPFLYNFKTHDKKRLETKGKQKKDEWDCKICNRRHDPLIDCTDYRV